jgi:energy-coupling factor transporter transmembrane protein EcfT
MQRTASRIKITPFSLIFSMPVFIAAVVLGKSTVTLVIQGVFLLISVLIFTLDPSALRWKRLLSLTPLLLFVVLFNAFRGGGEILFRAGPLMLMRQGLVRGIYYAFFILELWVMSGFLTGFEELQLISTLYTIGWFLKGRKGSGKEDMSLMLISVLKLFHSTYVELRRFFARGSGSLKRRTLVFIAALFRRAEGEFENSGNVKPVPLRPRSSDYLFVTIQVVVHVIPFIPKVPGHM